MNWLFAQIPMALALVTCTACATAPRSLAPCALETVRFEYDSVALTAEARDILDDNVACIAQYPGRRVLVESHTDERGTAEYNLALAQRQAMAVERYLTDAGIDGQRLQVRYYGEERPVCSSPDDACRAKNRRVEMHFHTD